MIGIVLIIVGFFFLARNLGLLGDVQWSVVWPTMLIIIGVLLMTKRGGWRHWHEHHWHGHECDCASCRADRSAEKARE